MAVWLSSPFCVALSCSQKRSCNSCLKSQPCSAAAGNPWYSGLELDSATFCCILTWQGIGPPLQPYLMENPIIDLWSVCSPLQSALLSPIKTGFCCCVNTNLIFEVPRRCRSIHSFCRKLVGFCWFLQQS